MGSVFNAMFGMAVAAPVWWLLFYVLFVGLNIVGVEATFRFSVLITILALGILIVFWVGAITHFSWQMALNIEPGAGNSRFLPFGWDGCRASPALCHLVLSGHRATPVGR